MDGSTLTRPGDCSDNSIAMTVLAVAVGVMAFGTGIITVRRLIGVCQAKEKHRDGISPSFGKHIRTLFTRPLFRFLFLAAVYDALILSCSALRLFTTHRAGSSIASSILFGFNDIVFWLMTCDTIKVWTGLLFTLLRVNNKLQSDSLYHRLNFFLGVGAVIGGLAGVWIWIMPAVDRVSVRASLMIGHIAFHAGVVVVLSVCLVVTLNGIEPLLMQAAETTIGTGGSGSSSEIGIALQKIKTGRKFLLQHTLPPGLTLDIIFAAVPYLRNKVEYQVWVSLLQAQGMIFAFLYMTRVDKPHPEPVASASPPSPQPVATQGLSPTFPGAPSPGVKASSPRAAFQHSKPAGSNAVVKLNTNSRDREQRPEQDQPQPLPV